MVRQCMRPGCDQPVAARLTYDTVACAVWLDPPGDGGDPAQLVCDVHAARLTAPRGWSVTDRRPERVQDDPFPTRGGTQRSLVPVPDPAPVAQPAPVAEPAPVPEPAQVPEPALAAVPEPAAAPAPGAEDPAPQVRPVRRRKKKVAAGQGPSLLKRAFDSTGPQHSVLTSPGSQDPSAADPSSGADGGDPRSR